MRVGTATTRFLGWLVAALAPILASDATAEHLYLSLPTFAVGDRPADVMAGCDAFLTEYRFQSGTHTYALTRALRGNMARNLIFIDERLVCVLNKRQYAHWHSFQNEGQFWSDQGHWQDPVAKWEWANEPGGLEYLAAMLREACGLETIRERRELEHEWSSRSMTSGEIANATGDVLAGIAASLPLAVLSHGYYSAPPEDAVRARQASEQRDRREVEQLIWSLPLGVPMAGIATLLPVPDVQYTWPRTGTEVTAYRLGLPSHFFVGVIDGQIAWIHAGYPGLILQSKLAAQHAAAIQK
jgi:hypothetical protein